MSLEMIPAAQETIKLVAAYLKHQTVKNDMMEKSIALKRFSARTIPSIDIYPYLQRILKYAPCSAECFLAVLIYFDRMMLQLKQEPSLVNTHLELEHGPFIINSHNIHRLLITGIMVAVKFMSDVFYTNVHVSRVGGLPVEELNRLEVEFLLYNDFNLLVSPQELVECFDRIQRFSKGL